MTERQLAAGPGKIIIIFCQFEPVILKTRRSAGKPVQADRQTVSFRIRGRVESRLHGYCILRTLQLIGHIHAVSVFQIQRTEGSFAGCRVIIKFQTDREGFHLQGIDRFVIRVGVFHARSIVFRGIRIFLCRRLRCRAAIRRQSCTARVRAVFSAIRNRKSCILILAPHDLNGNGILTVDFFFSDPCAGKHPSGKYCIIMGGSFTAGLDPALLVIIIKF